MVDGIRRAWGNGHRPTVISIGVGSLIAAIVAISGVFINSTLDHLAVRFEAVEKRLERMENQMRDAIRDTKIDCQQDVANNRRRIERLEDISR